MPRRSRATEAFFGRRKGKPLRAAGGGLATCCRRYRIDLARRRRQTLATLFPAPVDDRAARNRLRRRRASHPSRRGRSGDRLHRRRALRQLHGEAAGSVERRRALKNIRVYDDDATQVLDWLPAGLDRPDRPALSRPLAEEETLEATVRQSSANLDRFDRVLKPGGAVLLCVRHRHLCQLDAAALPRASRLRVDGRQRRRLADAVSRAGRARATRPRRMREGGVRPI